jgi:glutamine phosphoribosylpyrophosphate amidotransferase
MCGIIGIVGKSEVAPLIYEGLTVLQHRGQDAAGMATTDNGKLFLHKDKGLVRDVFAKQHMALLRGGAGIGHVRYPTAGCDSAEEAQPLYVNSPFGIALSHNGNLTNAQALKADLYVSDRRHVNTESDSEVLLNILAHELQIRVRFSRRSKRFIDVAVVAMPASRCFPAMEWSRFVTPTEYVPLSMVPVKLRPEKSTPLLRKVSPWMSLDSSWNVILRQERH